MSDKIINKYCDNYGVTSQVIKIILAICTSYPIYIKNILGPIVYFQNLNSIYVYMKHTILRTKILSVSKLRLPYEINSFEIESHLSAETL